MPVGKPTGYVEDPAFVPDPLSHGSVPTDGLKGVWDSNLRRVTSLFDHIPWRHTQIADPPEEVAAPAPTTKAAAPAAKATKAKS